MIVNKHRGYLTLPTEEGDKVMHFSSNFISVLEQVTGAENIWEYIKNIKPNEEVTLSITCIYSAMIAYDLEEGNLKQGEKPEYTIFKVRDWLEKHLRAKPSFAREVNMAMIHNLAPESLGKTMGLMEKHLRPRT